MGTVWTKRPPSSIRIEGDVAYVSLKKGFEAIIDASDIPLVSSRAWRAHLGQHGHAYANTYINGEYVFMHRMLLDTPKNMHVDHIDGDGLNNRRSNIRNCTPRQNHANRAHDRRNLLKIKGVSPHRGRFQAKITPNGRTVHLGTYDTAEEAAAAYRGAAIALWGEFAKK